MRNVTLNVEGMKCRGCASRVRTALEDTPGVHRADVSLQESGARVSVDDGADPEDLVRAVREVGYDATVRD